MFQARILDGVDPDEGYTRTLFDLSKRMGTNAKLLLEDMKGKTAQVTKALVPIADIACLCEIRRRNASEFL